MVKHMKNLLSLCIALIACSASAQFQTIDLTTNHTNSVTTSAKIWIAGYQTNGVRFQITNADYTVTGAVVTVGDSPVVAWGKANTNFSYLDNRISTNIDAQTNYPVQSRIYPVLTTNLYPTASSNYLGTVPGFWNYTLTQYTNLDPLFVWYETATMTGTNYNPSDTFDFGTNGYWILTNTLPTNVIWLALACSNNVAQSGQPAWLTNNGVLVYSNLTTSPTVLGLFTNVTSYTLMQTTNFSPTALYGSGDGTNFWPIASGTPSTNTVYLSLIATTNNPAPGAFTALTVNWLTNPERKDYNNQLHDQDFVARTITAETSLAAPEITQLQTEQGSLSNQVSALEIFTNRPTIPLLTIASNTASTYGYGYGLLAYSTNGGTNWLNVSIGTNLWSRTLLTTNW